MVALSKTALDPLKYISKIMLIILICFQADFSSQLPPMRIESCLRHESVDGHHRNVDPLIAQFLTKLLNSNRDKNASPDPKKPLGKILST